MTLGLAACGGGSEGSDAARAEGPAVARSPADSAVAADSPGDVADTKGGPADTAADALPALKVVFETNAAAEPGGAMLYRGSAAFRLPPQPSRRMLAAIHVLSHGDAPPGSFGGGGIWLAVWYGVPDAKSSIRLAQHWLGSCEGQTSKPCWTGPTFAQPVMIEAGEKNVFVVISRGGGEGGSFPLPVAAAASPAAEKQETWAIGGTSWSPHDAPNRSTWTKVPADQPWIFRLLQAP
jgi:hypothetical protein